MIIIAGGNATRFGSDKGLAMLGGKTIIERIYDSIADISDGVVIVTSSEKQTKAYSEVLRDTVKYVPDEYNFQSPLVGVYSGLRSVDSANSLVLSCDVPFVSKELARMLLDLCLGKDAVIPRWPNAHIEPLQAAYDTKVALDASRLALKDGKRNMRAMIEGLTKILYVSTTAIRAFDKELLTFFNINTRQDLDKARRILGRLESYQQTSRPNSANPRR